MTTERLKVGDTIMARMLNASYSKAEVVYIHPAGRFVVFQFPEAYRTSAPLNAVYTLEEWDNAKSRQLAKD